MSEEPVTTLIKTEPCIGVESEADTLVSIDGKEISSGVMDLVAQLSEEKDDKTPLDVVSTKKPYVCTVCSKSFCQMSHLKVHSKSHEPRKIFICCHCGKLCRKQSDLIGHERIHTGEKPCTCEICGKSFHGFNVLRNHLRTHSGEKPFSCKYCSKTFSNVINRNTHERVHTGEKPYACKYCGKMFARGGDLPRHERTHNGIKPYQCTWCDKTFNQAGNLKVHQKSHIRKSFAQVKNGVESGAEGEDVEQYTSSSTTGWQQRHLESSPSTKSDANLSKEVHFPPGTHKTARDSILTKGRDVSSTQHLMMVKTAGFQVNAPAAAESKTEPTSRASRYKFTTVPHSSTITSPIALDSNAIGEVVAPKGRVIPARPTEIKPVASATDCISSTTKIAPLLVEPASEVAPRKESTADELETKCTQNEPIPESPSVKSLAELAPAPCTCGCLPDPFAVSGEMTLVSVENASTSVENSKKTRTRMRMYPCEVCGKSFYQTNHLQMHKKTHREKKVYACTFCSKSFHKQSDFLRHEKTHTGEKTYMCEVCSKCFSERQSLRAHQTIHTGEKPYKCNTCNKSFSQSNKVKRHEVVHTGEKRHECEYCGNLFARVHDLKRHERIHTGEKPYKCDRCSREFNQPGHLRKHEKTHMQSKEKDLSAI